MFLLYASGYIAYRYRPVLRNWTLVRGELIDKNIATRWRRGIGAHDFGNTEDVVALKFRLTPGDRIVSVDSPAGSNIEWMTDRELRSYHIGATYELRQHPSDPTRFSLIAHGSDVWGQISWIVVVDGCCWVAFFGLGIRHRSAA
jgi:hypothetical protein